MPGDKWVVTVRWPAQDASRDMSGEELKAFFDKIAPEYRYRSDRFLRPALDAADSATVSADDVVASALQFLDPRALRAALLGVAARFRQNGDGGAPAVRPGASAHRGAPPRARGSRRQALPAAEADGVLAGFSSGGAQDRPVFLTGRRARVQLLPGDIDPASGRGRLSYRQAEDLFARQIKIFFPELVYRSAPAGE
jgi:hypothetical protein